MKMVWFVLCTGGPNGVSHYFQITLVDNVAPPLTCPECGSFCTSVGRSKGGKIPAPFRAFVEEAKKTGVEIDVE